MTLGDRWITDWEQSERLPYYTRANAGEVLNGPVSPLGWTLVFEEGVTPGWARGFVDYGIYREGELPDHQPGFHGLFGGYYYIGLSHMRLWGLRAGGTVEAIDRAQLGAHPDTPPYHPHPDDECPECTERIGQTMAWIMSAEDYPEAREDRDLADAARRERPDLTALSDQELVERARSIIPLVDRFFHRHILSSAAAAVGPGILEEICAHVGRGEALLELLSGLGEVDSALPSWGLWDLSRRVRASAELTQLFDAGVPAVAAAIRDNGAAGDVAELRTAFAEFLRAYGSRGPNEFDIREPTWETRPELALALVDTVRRSGDEDAPALRRERLQQRRAALVEELRERLTDPAELKRFEDALRSAKVFLPARERTKSNIIKAIHEVRVAVLELGRRGVEAGRLADPADVTMLMSGELDEYVADPDRFTDAIRERLADYRELWDLEPPFIIADKVPPLGEWARRDGSRREPAAVGAVLEGVGGCAGTHQGTARVVLSPDGADALQPGDVLVAPHTDPAWTPLFLTAGAVVVGVGGRNSHAVIISRELGIPCVVSVTGATELVPDGATVTVDGAAGAVVIEAAA